MEKETAYRAHFIGKSQLRAMTQILVAEEGDDMLRIMDEVEKTINSMPAIYEQDGKGDDAIVYLHYFRGGMDWYITERDFSADQYQAFGYADFGYGMEAGYISIKELIENGVELDLYWTPKTIGEIKKEK